MIIPVFPVFNYVLNTDIYEALCINKDKPAMECNGKCHLAEELNTQEKEKKDAPILDINLKDYPIASVHFFNLEELVPSEFVVHSFRTHEYRFVQEFDIFHPPKQLV